MMKYAVVLLAVFVATASASLIDILTTVHNSAAFHHLPHPEQILVIELITETREGEVHNFIDQIGFARVITLLDREFAKLPSAIFFFCFNFQSASMLLNVYENCVSVSNSLDPDETPSYSDSHPDRNCLHLVL